MDLIYFTKIITGISAGVWFAWSITVLPGTKEISSTSYLETMKSVNKKIINPPFLIAFFGPGLLLVVNALDGNPLMIAAAISYLFGLLGVTIVKNVPLNNKLEALNLDKLSDLEKDEFREMYEAKWNYWQYIRTLFSMLAFFLVSWI